jgi:hypothetical protein
MQQERINAVRVCVRECNMDIFMCIPECFLSHISVFIYYCK